jgi:glutamyl endopeptidase
MDTKTPSSTEALSIRRAYEQELRRRSAELARAREMPATREQDMHRAVSSRVVRSETATFEPSFGALGKSEAGPGGNAREAIAPAAEQPAARSRAMPTGELKDAWVASIREPATRTRDMQPSFTPRVVIGDDDRIEVTNNEAYPWRCICSLVMTSPNGTGLIGTGWLVSPRLVLTAGHCVYCQNPDYGIGWMQQPMTIIPGRRGDAQPFGSATSGDYRSVVGWTDSGDRDYDYGAIILPETARFGDQLGWFGYTTRTDEELQAGSVNLAGYPGDNPSGTMWWHARAIDSVGEKVITYSLDTFGGQSGAPVWQLMPDGNRYGVGVHTNGHVSGNSATRITSEVFNNIVSWVGLAP